MKRSYIVKFLFYTVFGSVIGVFVLKGVLLVTRYSISASSSKCEKNHSSNQTSTSVGDDFIFTTIVYAIINVLRIMEYVILAKQFYYFLAQNDNLCSKYFFKEKLYWLFLLLLLLSPYFVLGAVIPSLGIVQEIEHSEWLPECSQHYQEVYISYCAVNFLRYLSAYLVRVLMIYFTLSLRKIWFPEGDPPGHTSLGLDKHSARSKAASQEQPGQAQPLTNAEQFEHNWCIVSCDFKDHTEKYNKVGEQAKIVQELFQTWFILPWMIYLIASYLKTYNVLKPWNADSDGVTPLSDIPQMYYLLFNINQLITLLIPYLCARKMNTYHQKYFKLMRNEQLLFRMDSHNQLFLARQLKVEWESDYDFEPRIMGTDITMSVGSPLYVVILLAGIFLSVSESLLS